MPKKEYTTGELALMHAHRGVQVHHVRAALDRFMPDCPRLGRFRVVAAEDVPKVTDALRRCGYLLDGCPVPAAC